MMKRKAERYPPSGWALAARSGPAIRRWCSIAARRHPEVAIGVAFRGNFDEVDVVVEELLDPIASVSPLQRT